MNLALRDFDVFCSVCDLFTNLLISLVLIINTDVTKSLAKVFVAVMLGCLLKILQIVNDVAGKEGLDFDSATYLF